MRIALRAARPDDFDFCSRLYFSGMEETIRELKLDMAAQTANLRDRWIVTEVKIITCDNADLGWLQSSMRDDAIYLGQIFIDAAFQRRGIGTKIIGCLIDEADKTGRHIRLSVAKSNPARRLYERLGFRVEEEDDRKFHMRRRTDS